MGTTRTHSQPGRRRLQDSLGRDEHLGCAPSGAPRDMASVREPLEICLDVRSIEHPECGQREGRIDLQIEGPGPAGKQARPLPWAGAAAHRYRAHKPKLFQQVIEGSTISQMLASPRGDVPITPKRQAFCRFPTNQSI